MSLHPAFLHLRQIGIAGIEIAGDLFTPAALDGIHQLHRGVGDGHVEGLDQRRVGGGKYERQVAEVEGTFDLIKLAELQLVDNKAGAGFIGNKVVAAAIEQGIHRLKVVVIALYVGRHRL
ncbi:hypothetical protein D3C78_1508410 [compost metagenome]